MPEVVGVRFKQAGPIYFFERGGVDFEVGDWVVVDTAHGQSMGKAIMARRQVSPSEIQGPLKSVVRKAEPGEISKMAELRASEKETLIKCAELVAKHDLPMKVIAAEYNFDGSRLTVYFTAESKVDFRALLKEMGSVFKTRVELRQIGARDVAKLLGGIGRCGRVLCCTTCLCRFDPISMKMARDQGLSLNPAMISGVCGKLLCCLKYEHEQYLAMKSRGES
ncbi:stage 0 sporulation family protein [Dehalococcoidia bacterium]|nr:stage 0 sporulation family protein [Dehalococcoidia bacterium]